MKLAAFLVLNLLLAGRAQAQVCEVEAHKAEQAFGLPDDLLVSIGHVESGRQSPDGRIVAWPWSVNAAGEGHFLASAAEAIDLIRSLQARGIRSIDVGCFQVNLQYHPEAFATVADALDPAQNAAVAARFLRDLHGAGTEPGWNDAVARYHSADPALGDPYLHQVLMAWRGGANMAAHSISQVAALIRVIVPQASMMVTGIAGPRFPTVPGTKIEYGGHLPIVIVPSGPKL